VRGAEREAVYRAIQYFVDSHRGRVVVASRPAGFSPLTGVKEYTLKPFEDPEKEALPYLRKWLRALKENEWTPQQAEEKARRLLEEMRARPALARLLNNPLLLRLSAEHYVRTGRVAESRAALYEAWVEEAWRRAEKRGAPADQKGTALQALETLAWHLQTGGSHGEEALREALERAGLPDPQGLLRLLREGTGLLARFAGEQEGRTVYSYFFAHQTVQEYFVARRLRGPGGPTPAGPSPFCAPGSTCRPGGSRWPCWWGRCRRKRPWPSCAASRGRNRPGSASCAATSSWRRTWPGRAGAGRPPVNTSSPP